MMNKSEEVDNFILECMESGMSDRETVDATARKFHKLGLNSNSIQWAKLIVAEKITGMVERRCSNCLECDVVDRCNSAFWIDTDDVYLGLI